MAKFLDTTIETEYTDLPNNHGTPTLNFIKKVLKGIRYADLTVIDRAVVGQVKNGDGTDYTAVASVIVQCDDLITVDVGTIVTTGKSSIQIDTDGSGAFQVTLSGSQGTTIQVTISDGVTTTAIVGTGGTGGGGGGGISGLTLLDEGVLVDGGPHATMNFRGSNVTVSDAGGGAANVDVSELWQNPSPGVLSPSNPGNVVTLSATVSGGGISVTGSAGYFAVTQLSPNKVGSTSDLLWFGSNLGGQNGTPEVSITSGTYDNFTISSSTLHVHCNGGDATIRGIILGPDMAASPLIWIWNNGPGNFILANEYSGVSLDRRLMLPAATVTVAPFKGCMLSKFNRVGGGGTGLGLYLSW